MRDKDRSIRIMQKLLCIRVRAVVGSLEWCGVWPTVGLWATVVEAEDGGQGAGPVGVRLLGEAPFTRLSSPGTGRKCSHCLRDWHLFFTLLWLSACRHMLHRCEDNAARKERNAPNLLLTPALAIAQWLRGSFFAVHRLPCQAPSLSVAVAPASFFASFWSLRL